LEQKTTVVGILEELSLFSLMKRNQYNYVWLKQDYSTGLCWSVGRPSPLGQSLLTPPLQQPRLLQTSIVPVLQCLRGQGSILVSKGWLQVEPRWTWRRYCCRQPEIRRNHPIIMGNQVRLIITIPSSSASSPNISHTLPTLPRINSQ
jgi:hypothetical protein